MEFDWVFLSFYLVLLGFMWFHEVLWDFYVVLLVFIRFSWVFTWFYSVWLRVWGIYCLIYHLVHNGDSVATPDDVTELIGPQSGEGLAAISIGHRPNGSIHIVKKKKEKKWSPTTRHHPELLWYLFRPRSAPFDWMARRWQTKPLLSSSLDVTRWPDFDWVIDWFFCRLLFDCDGLKWMFVDLARFDWVLFCPGFPWCSCSIQVSWCGDVGL